MKLWKIEIERAIMVMADTEEQALTRARRYESQETMNEPDSIRCSAVTQIHQIPPEQRGFVPYFAPHDHSCERIVREQDSAPREQIDR